MDLGSPLTDEEIIIIVEWVLGFKRKLVFYL
jgi:hypothetical protein